VDVVLEVALLGMAGNTRIVVSRSDLDDEQLGDDDFIDEDVVIVVVDDDADDDDVFLADSAFFFAPFSVSSWSALACLILSASGIGRVEAWKQREGGEI